MFEICYEQIIMISEAVLCLERATRMPRFMKSSKSRVWEESAEFDCSHRVSRTQPRPEHSRLGNRPTPHRHEVWNIAAILRNILQFKISVFMWIYCTCDLFSIIPPVFSVTWSSEIILIYCFAAREIFLIIINVKNSCAASYFGGNSFAVNFSVLFNEYKVQNNSIYFKQDPL